MISSKFLRTSSAATAVAAILGLGMIGAHAEDQSTPADAPGPAATDNASPATEPTAPDAASAPADTAADKTDAPASTDATTATAPSADPAKGTNDSADVAPVKSETSAAPAEPPTQAQDSAAPAEPSTAINASQLTIGTAVFAADGAKIGEVNRVMSGPSGNVEEIRVTAGGRAGLDADVIAIPVSKITEVKDGVKLSLSPEEAKKLPVIGKGNG
jgi:hypothetical protein